jgi:hypothetical protein
MSTPVDWVDPGHDLPEPGTYRELTAWVTSEGKVYVGQRGIEVLPATDFTDEYRLGHDGIASSPPSPRDRPCSRWVRLVGPWKRVES